MDAGKFNFNEIFSNKDGKSSGSGFAGVIGFLIASLCFLMGVIDKMWITHTPEIMNNSLVYLTLAAGLLGVRKVIDSKEQKSDTEDTKEE